MAVDPIKERISAKTGNLSTNEQPSGKEVFAQMTAQEILDAYNNEGLAVPKDVLEWAQATIDADPNSTVKYGEANPTGEQDNPQDAVSYVQAMQEEGMSLKQMCREMTDLSKEMEARDLNNVTQMSPFAGDILDNQSEGDSNEREVSKLMKELVDGAIKDWRPWGGKNFKEDMRFFNALKAQKEENVEGLEVNLEDIESILNGSINDSNQSMEYGAETVALGQTLKHGASKAQKILAGAGIIAGAIATGGLMTIGAFIGGAIGALFGSSRKRIANKAIDQGNKTLEMGQKTNKLAVAIAKDNSIALQSLLGNETTIDQTGGEGEGGGGDNPDTGSGATQAAPTGGTNSTGGGTTTTA